MAAKNQIFAIFSKSVRRTTMKQPLSDPLSPAEKLQVFLLKKSKMAAKTQIFAISKSDFCDFLKRY